MPVYLRTRGKALKLPIPYDSGKWALYHLEHDPAEAKDLADQHPEKTRELAAAWDRYARENGVMEPDRPISYAKAPKDGSY